MKVNEINIDGLVGPTHNYAGLASGNIASEFNAYTTASPKTAVKQAIKKLALMHELGIKQAILPPHARPNLPLLESLGFTGKTSRVLIKAYKHEAQLLAGCYSASSMWAANSASITSSLDSEDGKLHITPANLISNFHRHQEAEFSQSLFKQLFNDDNLFTHHAMLPRISQFGDEGAANHTRLCKSHAHQGVSLFVYGKKGFKQEVPDPRPLNYPARQTLEASMAVARNHQVTHSVFAQQNPEAIDAGVFHNDVIGVGNESVYFFHEQSFLNKQAVIDELNDQANFTLQFIEVANEDLSLEDAVSSYLFNSQLVTIQDKEMALIAPQECQENERVSHYLKQLINDSTNPINRVEFVNLKQSMRNGGGPACLRLRVPLTNIELAGMKQSVFVTDSLIETLDEWADKHYRDKLHVDDLLDHRLVDESYNALDDLTQILDLGSIYHFQQE